MYKLVYVLYTKIVQINILYDNECTKHVHEIHIYIYIYSYIYIFLHIYIPTYISSFIWTGSPTYVRRKWQIDFVTLFENMTSFDSIRAS